ncbi:radical SAM mobile pair protein B [Clostridium estertheticum]|uniref:radical SAM mobile pair protein B n=1 Tax=Clostridium estertheticum TaxID=238834 RepID=UPI001CF22945|nr:radical SAM mobile pair protein B [Clostridium estertheticum]MCB2360933.1 radical SAM mobile pair protein B [Clostridium estertheticum]
MELVIKDIKTKGVLTKSNLPIGGYSANPYTGCAHNCRYCYASFMKRFTNHSEPWGEFVDIKHWPEIKHPEKYAGQKIFISSVTDPYQPLEEKHFRTRTLLEQLQGSGAEISIATKSDLILRDLDLIKSFPNARVSWSINSLDDEFRADMDDAVSIERRLAAMKVFHDAGIRTTCFISPIFPGITDVAAIIRRAKEQCNLIWLENLNLRGGYKTVILDYVKEKYPKLIPLYQDIYQKNDRSYWASLDEEIKKFTRDEGLLYVRNDDSICRPFEEPPIVVNYFFHEEIIPSAKKKKNCKSSYADRAFIL